MTFDKKLDYSQYISYVAVVYAFVLPLSRAGVSIFTILLMLLWIVEGDFKNKFKKILGSPVIMALFTFIFFNFISLFWTDDLYHSLSYIRRYWYLLPILVLFTSLKKSYVTTVLSGFILAMFISEIISYCAFFEWYSFKFATPQNPSPFMHHIEYSVFLAFTALVLLSRTFNGNIGKEKIIYSIFFMTMSGNLFLTAGRTGQIALVLGLFVLALISFENKIKAFFIAIVLSSVLFVTAFTFSNTFHSRMIMAKESINSVLYSKNYCSSIGARVGATVISKDIILSAPLLGMGITDNMTELRHIIDNQYPEMECVKVLPHMHNQYLEIWTQLGLIGLVIFLNIFYQIFKLTFEKKEYFYIKSVYMAVVLSGFITEVLFHRAFSLTLFSLVIGLLLAEKRNESEV